MATGALTKSSYMTPQEISLFFREYYLLFSSGISFSDAAYIMTENPADGRPASLCKQIAQSIDEGFSLADALKSTGKFPPHVIHMVSMGQTSGRLEDVLNGLALYYDRQHRLETTIRSALTYPLIMVSIMVAVLGVLIVTVLPMFARVFQDTGVRTPLILRLVSGNSGFTFLLIGILIALLILTIIFFAKAGRTLTVNEENHGLVGSLPFMKKLSAKSLAGEFAYNMALLLSGGVHIEDALIQTSNLTESTWIKRICQRIEELMSAGDTFAVAVSKCEIFDGTYASLLIAGEKSGKTDAIMNLIADKYTEEVDNLIHSVLALIEPTLVIIISIIIGAVLLSIMLPLMNVIG